jgi:hypothetical protein
MAFLVIMAVIMKDVGVWKLDSFRTLVSFCHSTQCHIAEDRAVSLFLIIKFRLILRIAVFFMEGEILYAELYFKQIKL